MKYQYTINIPISYIPINITSVSGVWGWPLCWRTAWSARPGAIVGSRLENFWKLSQKSEKIFWKSSKFLEILENFWKIGKQLEHFGESGFFCKEFWDLFGQQSWDPKLFKLWKTMLGSFSKNGTNIWNMDSFLFSWFWWAISTSGCVRRFQHGGASLSPSEAKAMATWAPPMEPCRRHEMGPWFHGVPYTLCVNIQKMMENHKFSWENSLFQWPFSIANC